MSPPRTISLTRAWFVTLAGRGGYGLLPGDFSLGGSFGAGLRWGPWVVALEGALQRGGKATLTPGETLRGELLTVIAVLCRDVVSVLGVCVTVTSGAMTLTRTLLMEPVWRRTEIAPFVAIGARIAGEWLFTESLGLQAHGEIAMPIVSPVPFTESTRSLWAPNTDVLTLSLGIVARW